MQLCKTIPSLREAVAAARRQGHKIAFVPTMGNLHAGHLSLVEKALQCADFVVVSIFVNPMQFGANEDLDSYPRTEAADQQALQQAGVHCLFLPSVTEMYPIEMAQHSKVTVPVITTHLCGASRPGHFDGVSTVVSKLFNMVQPDVALFGQKDFQQLAVIRKMVRDLCLPIEIIGVPTGRAEDGLALSSRNGYLSPAERQTAPALFATLSRCAEAISAGRRDFSALEGEATKMLAEQGFKVDYVSILDADSLQAINADSRTAVMLAAASLGNTRLLDNVTIPLIKEGN